jgi:septal ring factor EnvC (AmiA/AmiB activator)
MLQQSPLLKQIPIDNGRDVYPGLQLSSWRPATSAVQQEVREEITQHLASLRDSCDIKDKVIATLQQTSAVAAAELKEAREQLSRMQVENKGLKDRLMVISALTVLPPS